MPMMDVAARAIIAKLFIAKKLQKSQSSYCYTPLRLFTPWEGVNLHAILLVSSGWFYLVDSANPFWRLSKDKR